MGVDWYHLAPVILTDDVFFAYVGPTLTGTATQRTAAYLQAEQAMIRHLETPLLPTTMTGTFMWPHDSRIVLPHQHIQSVDLVVPLSIAGTGTCGLYEHDGCSMIRDGIGYIDVHCVSSVAARICGTASLGGYYQVRVTYTAGLPTGVAATDTSLHMALSMAAEEVLMQIVDPGGGPGGPGAPGIKAWGTLGYSEQFADAAMTKSSLGTSARMSLAARMVRHLVRKRALRFH